MNLHLASFGMTWFQGTRFGQRLVAVLVAVVLLGAFVPTATAIESDLLSLPEMPTTGIFGEFPDSMSLPRVNAAISADDVHASGVTGAGIDVAVIDTGVNGVPGLSGAGKIVDAVDLSFDAGDNDLRYRDLFGHGTVMAGIIAGDTSGGTLLNQGVAPGARIINVKVGAGDGTVDVTQVIAGIDWVVENRAAAGMNIRVLSLAFGTDADIDWRSDPLTHAVERAWRNGIVVVVAGGNDGRANGRLANPALDPYVIAVGAAEYNWNTNNAWSVASWSSIGSRQRPIDVLAPGSLVVGPRVPGSFLDLANPLARKTSSQGASLFRGSGTSQAQAVVAGAAALVLEAHPGLTPDEVKASFSSTATRVSGPKTRTGDGAIDVAKAIASPAYGATQNLGSSQGTGSIQASRGSLEGPVSGNRHAFDGEWDSSLWAGAT